MKHCSAFLIGLASRDSPVRFPYSPQTVLEVKFDISLCILLIWLGPFLTTSEVKFDVRFEISDFNYLYISMCRLLICLGS